MLVMLLYILLVVVMAGLVSCSKAPNAVLKAKSLAPNDLIATDSRLRVVNSADITTYSIPGEVDPRQIICAEPSPDVATTIANSFGAGTSILRRPRGFFTAAHVEGLVQLGERTATIQLLRDKMYQTCLAYANGAISGTTYSFIMSRLDDTIVTLLMGETAGGAFGRGLASIGGKSSALASVDLSTLTGNVANLEKRIEAATIAEEELRAAERGLSEHNAITPKPEDKETHANRAKELKESVDKARAKRDATQGLMKDTMAVVSNSSAEISEMQSGGGLEITPSPLIADTLADMQAEFLLHDASSSIMTACLVELGRKFGTPDSISGRQAANVFLRSMQTGEAVTVADAANAGAKASAYAAVADAYRLSAEGVIDAARLAAGAAAANTEAAKASRAAEAARVLRDKAMKSAREARSVADKAGKEGETDEVIATQAAQVAQAAEEKAAKVTEDWEAARVRADEAALDADAAQARATQAAEVADRAESSANNAIEAALAVDTVFIGSGDPTKYDDFLHPGNAKRITGSQLASFCGTHLREIIDNSSERHDKFRTYKATITANVDELQNKVKLAAALALSNEAFVKAVKQCEAIENVGMRDHCLRRFFRVPFDGEEASPKAGKPDPRLSPDTPIVPKAGGDH